MKRCQGQAPRIAPRCRLRQNGLHLRPKIRAGEQGNHLQHPRATQVWTVWPIQRSLGETLGLCRIIVECLGQIMDAVIRHIRLSLAARLCHRRAQAFHQGFINRACQTFQVNGGNSCRGKNHTMNPTIHIAWARCRGCTTGTSSHSTSSSSSTGKSTLYAFTSSASGGSRTAATTHARFSTHPWHASRATAHAGHASRATAHAGHASHTWHATHHSAGSAKPSRG